MREKNILKILHTGQHYTKKLSTTFINNFKIPKKIINIKVGSGSHGLQTSMMIAKIDKFIRNNKKIKTF